ncbi:hypothetical protein B0J14DRAFT_660111 [Halenospora varia]|nr:hypothetical protein B0J14DRAFT_660111 [Halenospora varia]
MDTITELAVVGIDIGQTYTGVAICATDLTQPDQEINPAALIKWPGTEGKKAPTTTDKVPTRIAYMAGDVRIPGWGYACPERRELVDGMKVQSLFKFLMNQENLDQVNQDRPPIQQQSMANIHMWYTDFLTKLYEHIIQYLANPPFATRPWNIVRGTTRVEFLFSLPTSWEGNDTLIAVFETIIKNAGFGAMINCSAKVGLIEGVASAVYTVRTLKHDFKVGDIFLVCDAGGATSDLCALRVLNIDRKTVELETILKSACERLQIICVPFFQTTNSALLIAIFAGSGQIDTAFASLFQQKLGDLMEKRPDLFENYVISEYAAEDVAQGNFQDIKMQWGDNSTSLLRFTSYKVPGRHKDLHGKIQEPYVRFLRGEIDSIFDDQIDQIIAELDKRLDCLVGIDPLLTVSGLILAGGLGSSEYLQSRIRTHYEPRGIKVLVDPEPKELPLSVCKGLVYDRMQRVLHGTSVFRVRRCRASYGLLCDVIYNKAEHKDRKYFINEVDGRKYVRDQIQWFVKKDDKITEGKPIIRDRSRKTTSGNPDMTWTDKIVMSRYKPDCLPHYLGQGDSHALGEVRSTAEPDTLSVKRKYSLGRKFLQGEYQVWIYLDGNNLTVETKVGDERTGLFSLPQVPLEFTQETPAV